MQSTMQGRALTAEVTREDEAADRVAEASARVEVMRARADAALDSYRMIDKGVRPIIGHLTRMEADGARKALAALGRELVSEHFPRVEYRVSATPDGERQREKAMRAVRITEADLTAARVALADAEAARRTPEQIGAAVEETLRMEAAIAEVMDRETEDRR